MDEETMISLADSATRIWKRTSIDAKWLVFSSFGFLFDSARMRHDSWDETIHGSWITNGCSPISHWKLYNLESMKSFSAWFCCLILFLLFFYFLSFHTWSIRMDACVCECVRCARALYLLPMAMIQYTDTKWYNPSDCCIYTSICRLSIIGE